MLGMKYSVFFIDACQSCDILIIWYLIIIYGIFYSSTQVRFSVIKVRILIFSRFGVGFVQIFWLLDWQQWTPEWDLKEDLCEQPGDVSKCYLNNCTTWSSVRWALCEMELGSNKAKTIKTLGIERGKVNIVSII